MKTVYKYGTGQDIPEDAKYLCTKVETQRVKTKNLDGSEIDYISNVLVWHYYEVKLDENYSRD